MMRIYQEIALYGTSEKRMNLRRGIQKIRDFMMPESHNIYSHRFKQVKEAINVPDKFMVENGSNFHKFWGIIMIILLLYTAILMPYKTALIEDKKDAFYYIDTLVDFIFMVDIIINFNMPIDQKYKSEPDYDRRKIAL